MLARLPPDPAGAVHRRRASSAAGSPGELAFQNIVWQVDRDRRLHLARRTAGRGPAGSVSPSPPWPGWGSSGWASSGRRAAMVTAAALERGAQRRLPGPRPSRRRPTWGRWWRVTRAIPFKSRAVETTANIDYWGDGIRRHRLDVHRSRLAPPEKAPVMVYIHGGAWIIGDKREQGKPMMYELVARGWVCVAINYRLSPKATWPDHIVDAKRAVAWVKEHIAEYGGDPSFVAVSGGSAGGHLCRVVGPERGRPGLPAGVRRGRHHGPGLRPLLRRHGHDGIARRIGPLRAGPARDAREDGHEDEGVRAPRGLPPGVPHLPGPARGATLLRAPGRQRHPGARRDGPHVRRAARARSRANRWPTPSCPWPSTPSTCWPHCAVRPRPRPSPTSSRGP